MTWSVKKIHLQIVRLQALAVKEYNKPVSQAGRSSSILILERRIGFWRKHKFQNYEVEE